MKSLIRFIAWGALLIFLQTTVVPLFAVEGVMPDLLTIWLVFVALREGQTTATIAGFSSGLLLDFFSGDFLGIGALAKTCSGFVAGYFYDSFKTAETIGTYRFFFAMFFSSLLHNLLFFIIYLAGTDIPLLRILLQYGAGTTAYSTALSLIPMYWMTRK